MAPLLIPALAVVLGVLLAAPLGPSALPPLVGLAALGALWAVARPGRIAPVLLLGLVVGAAASAGSGGGEGGGGNHPSEREGLQGKRRVDAVAAARPLPRGDGCELAVRRVQLRVGRRWVAVAGVGRLHLSGSCPPLRRGHRLRGRARVFVPAVHPGSVRRGPAVYLRAHRQEIARVGRVSLPADPFLALRQRALGWLAPWRSAARGVLAAVLVGDRRWLAPRHRAHFRRSGTAHLLAISGLHVALVSTLLFGGLRWVLCRFPALVRRVTAVRPAAVIALGGTWLFVVFSGAGPPAVRAGWMASAWLGGLALGRRAEPWSALALAALFVSLWDPAQWRSAGCQLSFAAVAGLLLAGSGRGGRSEDRDLPLALHLGSGPAAMNTAWGHRLARRVGRLLRATAVATLCTAPLVAYHFGAVTAAGLAVNLLAVPLLCVAVVPLGLAGLALSGLGWSGLGASGPGASGPGAFGLGASGLLGWLPGAVQGAGAAVIQAAALAADALLWTVSQGARWLAPLTGAVTLSGAQLLCVYLALGGLWRWRTRWGRRLLAGAVAALGLLVAASSLGPGGGQALRVTFLDVGAGDAILITLPDGRHALVDAPGSGARRRHVDPLVRRLRRLGVRRLAFVVATHPHADHVGGLPAVLEALPVGVVYHSGQRSTRPEWRALLRMAARRGVPLRIARDRRFGAVRLEVLAPRRPVPPGRAEIPVQPGHRGRVTPVRPGRPVPPGRAEIPVQPGSPVQPGHRGRVAPDPLHSANDASLVLRLSHPGGSVLLLGDLERAGEAALLSRHGRPHATVMKTAHHGRANATSARLLRAVRPHLAVISCRTPERGRHSPQAAVLRRLARARVPALLTGRHGDITVTLAPWGILVQSTRGPRLTLPPDPATPFPSPRALAAPVALPRSR